jgi:hypothetical protein
MDPQNTWVVGPDLKLHRRLPTEDEFWPYHALHVLLSYQRGDRLCRVFYHPENTEGQVKQMFQYSFYQKMEWIG